MARAGPAASFRFCSWSALAVAGVLLGGCFGHEPAYYFNFRPRTAQRFDAAMMSTLESEAESLGLVVLLQNERVLLPGEIFSTLRTPKGEIPFLEVVVIWYTNREPGSPNFLVVVGSGAKQGLEKSKPRIDEVATRLLHILADAYGEQNISVELETKRSVF
jgi:hypothetical protein